MAILETTDILQEYIAVRNDFVIEDLKPFKRQALREYVKPFVGKLDTELASPATGENAEIKNEARELLEETVACFSFYLGAPELALQISGSGISVAETTNYKKANTFEKNEFQRNLLRRAHTSLDALLLILEDNASLFSSYTAELQDINKELIVNSTQVFNQYYNIHNSRQTYLALKPFIRRVEDQYLSSWLCSEFITELKQPQTNLSYKNAKLLLQKATVAFTVSKAVLEGLFILDQNGIHLKFDTLEYEKTATNTNLKINDFLMRTSKQQELAGEEYLRQVSKYLIANKEAFTQCNGTIILEKDEAFSTSVVQISNNKRILSL